MKILSTEHVGHWDQRSPAVAAQDGTDLSVPTGGRPRIQRALEMAEVLFVGRVVQDGGIERWRLVTEARFLSARQTFAQRRRLSRSESAALVVALVDPLMRDRCWMLVESCPDRAWTEFWSHLVRRALSPYRAEPLFLLAWSAWRQRDPRLAAQAVDAALNADPRHTAATMLRTAMRTGLDPSRLPSLAGPATRGSGG
jgi:hypothetical protein